MRVWLDPARIASRWLTASDIVAAIRAQNVEVAAGSVGRQPNPAAAQQVALDVKGRLATEEEFAAIVVKTGADGQLTRLGEVARIEMGANDYRSEEHTSELQSLMRISYAVFCLKKKT